MAFTLGNFSIDEILFGVAQNFKDELLYTLDQLSSAEIDISSDNQDITDKNGNIVRTVYKNKTGTFKATNAFLHPQVMNNGSGSEIAYATTAKSIQMPKVVVINAGETFDASDAKEGTIHVIGLYGNGANGAVLTQSTTDPVADKTFQLAGTKITVPAAADGAPVQYLIKYERDAKSGARLANSVDKFPNLVHMTFYCSYVDPCSDTLKPCYVYIPSFMADPNVTISLSRDNQEMDFNGNLNVSYCSGNKILYYIYFPDEDIVKTAVAA